MISYFNSLGSKSYPTTIGNFTIVNMTSYFKVDDSNFVTTDINVDNTQTLIETANSIYEDIDSFWLFLLANKKINPFELLEENNSVLQSTAAGFTGIELQTTEGGDGLFTNGSLLFPKTENTGASWEFGSTGNFELNGGFALIDSYNPFSKRAVIKYVEGFTLGLVYDIGDLKGLVKGSTSYSWYDKTAGIYGITQELGVVNEVSYVSDVSDTNKEYVKVKSEYPLLKKGSGIPAYEPVGTGGIQTTISQVLQSRITQIKCYLPQSIKNSAFAKVVQNYKV